MMLVAYSLSANMDTFRLGLALMATGWLSAVEWTVPEAPLSIDVIESPRGNFPLVDWGVAGTARARHPQIIEEERTALLRWINSPEFVLRLAKLQQMGEAHEKEIIREQIEKWWQEYRTVEQPTHFNRRVGRLLDEHPLPLWAWGIPAEMRKGVQIFLFDDRDPAQRRWVIDRAASGGRFSIAFCTGWRNGEDRDEFWKNKPGTISQFSPIGTDDIATYYQVTEYPATIIFNDETMTVEQGMDFIQRGQEERQSTNQP